MKTDKSQNETTTSAMWSSYDGIDLKKHPRMLDS